MAVAIERSNSASNGLVNDPTISVQVDTADALLLGAFAYRGNDSADITAASRNAQSLTFQQFADNMDTQGGVNPDHRVEVWSRLNPSTGTSDLVGTNSEYKFTASGIVVLTGVNQTTPIPSGDIVRGGNNSAAGTTISATVPNMTADDLAVLFVVLSGYDSSFNDNSAATATDGASQTRLFDRAANATPAYNLARLIGTTKTGTGSVTLSVTMSLANTFGFVAMRVQGVGGGATIRRNGFVRAARR
jgi:hypothetical protein